NSLNEEIRWRIHSRATKIGQRMWNRNALCSKGVPWRSRMRNLISPTSDSSISSLRRAKETRAPFATDRSLAIASSSLTKPWSSTRRGFSVTTSGRTAKAQPTVAGLHVGTSGWSYPSWRGGFYPEGADTKTFLSFYAERFDTVELT